MGICIPSPASCRRVRAPGAPPLASRIKRGFGIPYLGMPRTRQAADAQETGQPVAGSALLAVACVALAVGAPVMLAALSRTARTVTGTSLGPLLLPGKLPSSRPTRTSPPSPPPT
jgi:hypothetical protein